QQQRVHQQPCGSWCKLEHRRGLFHGGDSFGQQLRLRDHRDRARHADPGPGLYHFHLASVGCQGVDRNGNGRYLLGRALMMRRMVVALVAATLAAAASAQTYYKWTDAKGVTHYSA